MNNILLISKNTFKETVKDKIFYGILAFALLFLLSTLLFGSISLGEDIKVIKDLGLAGIYIFSLIITIFLGSSLIDKEIEQGTLYVLLTKPTSKSQFIIGKFFGLWTSIILNIVLMTIFYLIIVFIKGGGFDAIALWSILLLIFELSILISLAIIFSTITTPLASTIYSILILYIGHSLGLIKKYSDKSNFVGKYLGDFTYYLFPNLEKFNIRNSVVHGITPNSSEVIYPIIYSILFSAVLLWLATIALKKQDP